ncbi:FAD binding domain-containing protein [Streptomyces sp. NPDC056672]|uniref:FAD binding domain-containing protein n=1 Tax=Streptomyces sp. NPDC056672 TaxID=3345906 RepID=UPI003691A368
MEFLSVATWEDALAARAAHPGALPIAGGTDVMAGLNHDLDRPSALLDLARVPELSQWHTHEGIVRLGACVTYARIVAELGDRLPGLAMASHTVGSPQIRRRGTVGGSLGSASPEGDAHPPLLAAGAVVEAASVRGVRRIPAVDFYQEDGRGALAADELIAAVLVPVATGPQRFSKIGGRQAMAVAVASFALSLDPTRRRAASGIGSVAPAPRPAAVANEFLTGELEASGLWDSRAGLGESLMYRYGELVTEAASPSDDIRATAEYRRLALAVMARRTLARAWSQYQGGQ